MVVSLECVFDNWYVRISLEITKLVLFVSTFIVKVVTTLSKCVIGWQSFKPDVLCGILVPRRRPLPTHLVPIRLTHRKISASHPPRINLLCSTEKSL